MFINSCKKVLTGFLFFISLFIISISCDSTEPTDELKPGRRDYIWTVDTLDTQCNTGFNPFGVHHSDDVWACGPGGLTVYDGLWHFDGNEWKPYSQALSISSECIYGFAQNNVWMGGNDGKIFRFNGTLWNQVNSIVRADTVGNWINYIWGDNPQVLYALGRAYLTNEPLPT